MRRVIAAAAVAGVAALPLLMSTPASAAEGAEAERSDMALTRARIPVHEALPGKTDVRVLKYLVTVGSSEGGTGKRVQAKDVVVDIFNKKLGAESKRIASVRGHTAQLDFEDVPDARTGFRDAHLLGMRLETECVVEYFNEAGETITTLRSQRRA